jgi:hypothetical protein
MKKPPVLVGAAIVGAALPLLISYAPFGNWAIERQIDREDRSLCERFEFKSGETTQHSECKAALADLRRQRELVLLH